MSRGERVYVSSAFVPFTRRRVDAVADLLVEGLRANGLHAERLRLPVDTRTPHAMAAAAAAAALVDVAWAHQMIQLEFPCLQLLHDHAAAWRVRGGLTCDVASVADGGLGLSEADVACRFGNHWVEPGALASSASPAVTAPPGVLSDAVVRAGIVKPGGTGMVVVSLAPTCDARAREVGAAQDRAHVVPATDAGIAAGDDPEDAVWQAVATVGERDFAGIHLLVPADADPLMVERCVGAAGAIEEWSAVRDDGTDSLLVAHGTGPSLETIHAQWTELASELLP